MKCYTVFLFESAIVWVSQIRNYLYGSRSFHKHEEKKFRKILIYTVLWLLNNLLSLKTDINVPVPTVCNKKKKLGRKNLFFIGILKFIEKKSRIWIRILRILISIKKSRIRNTDFRESKLPILYWEKEQDLDPYPYQYQNVMYPEHWLQR